MADAYSYVRFVAPPHDDDAHEYQTPQEYWTFPPIKHQTIEDVELQHQWKEPPRTIEKGVKLKEVAKKGESEPRIAVFELQGEGVPINEKEEGDYKSW